MAATLTSSSNDITYLSFPIEKTETTPDGDLLVYGKATDGSVDSDEQIVDTAFSSKAIADWLSSGANVRVQHNAQRDPAGVGVEVDTGPDGETWVKSLVIEPIAKRLVEKGALRAYSVGIARPKIVRDSVARGGRIVDGEIVEISLVDRPANKNCGIQLVKSAEDGTPEWVGKVFGSDILTKDDTVNVDVPKSATITFSPTDLAKLLEHRRIAEKRDMDPDVGGGVDRDKVPAADFAGSGRSFPIVTPKDVHDASLSLGRARGQDTDDVKRRIISIAHRKGDAFVAQLPEAWKKPEEKFEDADLEKAKKPFPGAAPPIDGQDSDGDGKDTDKPGSEEDDDEKKPAKVPAGKATEEPEVEKTGAKSCAKCGKNYHADSKLKRCEGCNAKLPRAEKAAMSDADLAYLVEQLGKALALRKGAMPPAESDQSDDEQDEDGGTTPDTGKGSKPVPGAGVVGEGASDIKPVPAHREPDGTAIESLEHDAGLPTTPDASVKTAMRHKSLGVPSDLGSMHDLLCPGFHPADTAKCYPDQGVSDFKVENWQAKALDAAVSAPLEEATKATAMWQHAVTIKGTEPEILAEIRNEAHKAFRDANPGPGTFPTPTELKPGSFRRAYISSGHANPGTAYDGPNTHSVPTGQTSANQFGRGFLATGHAEDSPSNKGVEVNAAPLPTGEAQRVYYRNSQREGAKAAMQAMHDHIAQTFPDLCPMAPSQGGQASPGARPVPVPSAKAKKAKKQDEVLNKAASADLLKSAITQATAPLLERLEEISQALKAEQGRTEILQKTVDALGDLPDPATAAFKGVALNPRSANKTASYPVGAQTVAEIAERTQMARLAELQHEARLNPDPGQREAAWAEWYRMTGVTPR